MANWDDVINNQLTMGRSRPLIYALNVTQRRRENGEEERRPGLIPPAGRGIRPVVPRFEHFGGFQEENFYLNNMARGRSRPFPAPWPYIQIHHRFQPHSLPRCLACGFGGYADPNIPYSPRINNPLPQVPNPQQYVQPLPLLKIRTQELKVPPQSPLTLRGTPPSKLNVAHPKSMFCLL